MTTKALEGIDWLSQRLSISKHQAYQYVREGVIPAVKLGRLVRFDPDTIDNFIRNGGQSLPGGWRKEGSDETT
jgi:excisionase family DNA binding protein